MYLNVDFFLNGLRESCKVYVCFVGEDFMFFVIIILKIVIEIVFKLVFIFSIFYVC